MSGGSPEVVEALRNTLKERDRLRRENQRLRAGATEPIAIVGMACRYPGGVGSSEDLWQLVAEGRDVISEFPTDRGWDVDRLYNPDPESFGTSYTREAGFLTDAGDFDADFFAISPREAEFMDPQERLLLESCWEALEDAGIDPASLKRTQTGVFAGVGERAYGPAAGMTSSIISGRVSYALGLEGPAISIDTACSSSLVALHLASQALRQGECTLALSGGVTVLSSPGAFISFSAQRGLAPDGRCKSFAEAADGVAWAEGVGMLVLERLSDATRNGHHVLALLKGSAVNQDGASNGLTAPNGPSQERVIRQALASAELSPQDVDVVEGHGTGTTLGDPIEAGALLATYGQERERPLKLGSIKSNIGHSQAAAGVAGVIKMALAMREGVLPKTLHVDAPSSKVDWESGQIELLSEQVEWDANGRPRRAGVSSFGISGTNAHVIVEQAPEVEPAPTTEPLQSQIPLALSAKAEQALAEAAERLAVHLRENPELDPTDVAYSLLTTRSALEHRAVVLGADREELPAGLASLANGDPSPNVLGARAKDGKLAYLFTGQGSQRLGMGKELYDSDPNFQAAFDAACEQLDQHLETPLKEIVFAKGKEAAAQLEDTTYAQPALFAIEVALYEALAKRGLKPDLLAGHSVGEIVAAHVAGAIELEDAAKLVAARGRLMGALPAGGAMAAIEATEEEVTESIAGKESELAIAAINGPTSTVISGAEGAVEAVRAEWEEKGRKTKRLAVSHAFHSPLMEPMLKEFAEIAASLTYGEPEIPIVSNISGELLDSKQTGDPAYWVRHVREAVRFADAVTTLQAQGTSTYLELGPDPLLCAMARESLGEDAEAAFVPTLRESRAEANAISTAIAAAHAAGAKPDWGVFFAGTGAKRVPLPTYPFQRRRYWFFSPAAAGDASAIGQSNPGHPLLAATIEGPSDGGLTLTGRLSLATHPWLAEHVVAGAALLPGTAFLELALRAGEEAQAQSVEELVLEAPLVFQPGGAVAIQVAVSGRDEDGRREIAIHSRPETANGDLADAVTWTRHAQGVLSESPLPAPEPLGSWPPEGAEPIEVDRLYDGLADAGLEYGPIFQGLTAAWRREESVYVEVSLPDEAYDAERFAIHPALLDAALHGIALAASEGSPGPKLPFSWGGVSLQAVGARALRARISPQGEGGVSLALADSAGAPLAGVASLALRPLSSAQQEAAGRPDDGLLRVEWSEASLGEQEEAPAEVEVLRCTTEEGSGSAEAAHGAAKSALRAIQGWLADEEKADLRLALITEGAMATAEDESPDPAAAAIWGLIRSAQSEHPGRFALIDSDGSEASQAVLPAALAIGIEEPQLALREGRALVPRLGRAPVAEAEEDEEEAPPAIDPERTVLITGATGGLGALVARHLTEHHGARHLLLVSRSGPEAEGATELRAELEERGARATIAACDAADRGALESLLATIPAEHPLGAVVHCAGTLADGTVETMEAEQVDRVFAAKVDAAWNLHELTAERNPTVFLLFSAVAGTFGAPGQANYAAANVFLDALAQKRQADGLPATSIAWGLWERGGGMASELGEADLARMRRGGIEALSDERGLAFLDAALGGDRATAVAVPLNTAGLRGLASVGALPPIFRGLVRVPRRRSAAATGSFATKLADLSEAEAEGIVLELVRGEVAGVLGHASGQEIEPGRAFQELGFDSLAAVELRNRLSAITGLRLPATVVFDYPSSAALAGYVLGEVGAGGVVKQVAVRAQASEEPIAIVGMACRYPGGVSSPEELWQLVAEGRDGISEFPADRGWDVDRLYNPDPDNPGTSYTREGGFLAEAGDFDAEFFGISPREALFTDPQQRLLLESCWEALEDAGIDPASLKKTQTGVFAGVMYQDYGLTPGGTSSVVSGRISYTLGLEGPAITVDTACSSSLVAMHLASQALRQGECTLALAGGVTALATPAVFVEFSRQRGLAADGRSKSFADAADGVAWGEGVGVLVLERLSEARRNGHPILALLKGSAVNQDGASNGLTAPNGPSQERVIRQALANARLEPKDVDVVEGHGTGTTLGDPIEAGALLATYGQDRETPLKLGSIKSNIGHTQAAAGVAGVIKMTEAMRQGVMPKTLHVDAPSSNVDWEAGEIELLSQSVEWEADGGPRRAGISSFGISGTNAHVILEEAPEPNASEGSEAPATAPVQGSIPLALSAKAEPALAEVAQRLAAYIQENPDLDPTDVAFSLLTTRSAFEHRAVVLGSDREELLSSLTALAGGEPSPNVLSDRARDGKLAYLFTGQGSQRLGMGKELYESDPHFQAAFDAVCEQLDQHLEVSLKEVVFAKGKEAAARLEDTTYAQPALFAIEVALFEALAKRGLKPDLLAGHSIGEIAAAHVAGVIDLADATKLVAARGRLMGALPAGGAMAAIEATEQEATESIADREAELAIAAINGPTSIVISGSEEAVEDVRAQWEERGRKTKRLAVSHAFHSPLMEPMLEEFGEVAASLTYSEPKIPIVSNVTGELLGAEQATDPAYWVRHVREAVRFADAIVTLQAQGTSTYMELGPDPVLCAMARETLGEDPAAAFVPTLRESRAEAGAMSMAIAQAHAAGAKPDWGVFFAGTGAKRVPLPTYPFQRRHYWLASNTGSADASAIGLTAAEHPLLGAAVELASGEGEGLLLTGRLSLATHPWLADHLVGETVLLPGTAFLELALRAAEQVGAETVEELTLQAPLVLPEAGAVAIQVSVSASGESGRREIAIHSRPEGADEGWVQNAAGALAEQPAAAPESLETWPPDGAEPVEVEYLYDLLAEHGLRYGPAFQCLTAAWRDGEQIFVEVSLAEEQEWAAEHFAIHPALLDAVLHGIALASSQEGSAGARLPFSWAGVSLQAAGARALRARISPAGEGEVSLALADGAGAPLARVGSLALRPLAPGQLQAPVQPAEGLLAVEWVEAALPEHEAMPPEVETLRCEIGGKSGAASAREAAQSALRAVQDWLADEEKADLRLALITEGAMATGEGESPDPAAATIWGLIRSAQSEHPGRFALIDSDGSEASRAALSAALAIGVEEPQIALREGRALAPRLARTPVAEAEEGAPPAIDSGRTVLITGATGGLGALVARHLTEHHGARHLLLVSRSGPEAEGAEQLREELETLGAEARIYACDVSDREALESLLATIPSDHPLGAVIHCAGALADGTIEAMESEQIDRVFAAKVDAAWNLHELTAELDLSEFLLFSSVAGTLGSPGQANYAAANLFLDTLAQRRRAEGLPATSIAWGLWERGGGMASELGEADLARMRRGGIEALSDERGLALFDAALGGERAAALALPLDTAGLRGLASVGALPPIFRGLVRVPRRRSAATGSLATKLATLPEAEAESIVLELVRGEVAAVLGHASAQDIEPGRAFQELGFDSLAAVELRNRLSAIAGLRLAATVVFDYPNAAALAEHLLAEATAGGEDAKVAVRARASEEPIAIVGMACRYPGGVSSPAELWRMVAEGRDGISGFPADRGWDVERLYNPDPDNPGTSYTREGGFLAAAGDFDPEFFGIAPREALFTDPQQRLLLESCWEALEDAGIEPASLRGTQAGVFAGVMYQDYGPAPGMTQSIVSGRIAYTLGLEGPAISVDTACSSSLVAMHLASQALLHGECGLALAGGVTVLSTPSVFVEFSRQRGLAPDGRSKSFSDSADGVAWAEGVGTLVLERLSDAERNGHPILALLKGSAVNQDGASNGLTAPNGPSQERVIRQALANARLEPKDVDVIEGHGTGTTLGDPIEAGALLATYGQDRETPLKLGSIKSNIGHTQAAAGVAGVIKMTEAMRQGVMPKTLHVDAPSSKVDWEAGEIELLGESVEWEANGGPRRAGVSSFGISGTNAHVILEEAPRVEAPVTQQLVGPVPLTISAKAESALIEAAGRLHSHLEANPELHPTDVAYSLATTRSAFEHRAVALGSDREELLASLASLANGDPSPNVLSDRARDGKLAYLFTGQGSQRLGMGKELYDSDPNFAAAFDAVCEQLDAHLGVPLREIVFAEEEEAAALLEDTTYAQPALFAIEVALFESLTKRGLKPDLLAGHSIGEIAAAHVAGVIELEDAAKLVAARGRLMGALPTGGAMAAIEATEEEAAESIAGREAELAIAAINGPTSTVISGSEEAVEDVRAQWEERGRKTKRLAVSHAFHSPLIEPMLEEFGEVAEGLAYSEPKIPIVSNVSGELLGAEQATDPAYWVGHVREAVRFADAIATLQGQGASTYLELGPDPVLCAMARESLGEDTKAAFVPTLREGRPEAAAVSTAVAGAYAAGAKLDWSAFFSGTSATRVPLPTYPFQRTSYWLNATPDTADAGTMGLASAQHPLLGAAVDLAGEEKGLLFTGRLSLFTHAWLADHMVGGAVLLPGTAFLELALRAAEEAGAEGVEELTLLAPLVLPAEGAVVLQIAVSGPGDDGRREIAIHSRPDSSGDDLGEAPEWIRHAEGTLSTEPAPAPEPLPTWPPEGAEPLGVEHLYDGLTVAGLEYGPVFQGLTAAWKDGDRIYAEVSLPEESAQDAEHFGIHPALLDSALHGSMLGATGGKGVSLPFSWRKVSLATVGASELRVVIDVDGETLALQIGDREGGPVATIGSMIARPLDPARLRTPDTRVDGLLALAWTEAAMPELAEPPPEVEVLHCAPEAGPDRAEAARTATQGALESIQDWLSDESKAGTRLTFFTPGAMATRGDEAPDPAAAAIWGLIRSAQSEHPGRFALIDSDGSEASQAALPAALAIGIEEPQLALREGVALVPRAAGLGEDAEEGEGRPIDPERTVLITGATGALGALTARHMVERHAARHLLLVSRTGPDAEGAAELKGELEALGTEVTIAACDVADREALGALLATVPEAHPLGAVIHCAGVLADGTVEAMGAEQIERVFVPKVDAAWNLHELSAAADLSAFVLFSSAAGTLGGPGQANYAAANVFLDALAQKRRAEGLPATSIAWGLWEQQGGMISDLEEADRARMRRGGVEMLSREKGLSLLDAALESERAALLAIPFNPAGLRALASAGALAPILSGLVRVPRRRRAASGSLAAKLASLPPAEREQQILDLVRAEAAFVLGHDSAAAVEPDQPFRDLGFDSLSAVELRNRLNVAFGLSLAATLVFDHPTAADLATHLAGQAQGTEGDGAQPRSMFAWLGREAGGEEKSAELIDLIGRAAMLRASFDSPLSAEEMPKADLLADGPESPRLLLLPSIMPSSGPAEYTQLAAQFRGERSVSALRLPGFSEGEPLPASASLALRNQAEAIQRLDLGPEFALVAHSSGGWFAQAAAAQLEEAGTPPRAVILIDTYFPPGGPLLGLRPEFLARWWLEQSVVPADDARLTATMSYFRIFADWRPPQIESPIVAIRAGDALADMRHSELDDPAASGSSFNSLVEVPGDHFSIIATHAETTAQAIRQALGAQTTDKQPERG